MTIGIYVIKNIENSKIYIGSSSNIERRWISHKHELNTKTHHSVHLQRAWDKHGPSSFEFSIIEILDSTDNLVEVEQKHLDQFRSFDCSIGYNISPTAGSSLGVKRSEEHKKACSERLLKRYLDPKARQITGEASKKAWTDEKKIAASEQMKQIWANPEIKLQRSAATSAGASRPENIEKRSKRMKDKFSSEQERHKARLSSPHRKRIQHVETGTIYESISEAAKDLPVSKQTVKNSLSGKFKSSKGMNFIYVEETI